MERNNIQYLKHLYVTYIYIYIYTEHIYNILVIKVLIHCIR